MQVNDGVLHACFARIAPDVLERLLELPEGASISAIKVADFQHGTDVLEVCIVGYGPAVAPGGTIVMVEPSCTSRPRVDWPAID